MEHYFASEQEAIAFAVADGGEFIIDPAWRVRRVRMLDLPNDRLTGIATQVCSLLMDTTSCERCWPATNRLLRWVNDNLLRKCK